MCPSLLAWQTGIFDEVSKAKEIRNSFEFSARQCENLKEYKNIKFTVIYKIFCTESIHTCTSIGTGLDANKHIAASTSLCGRLHGITAALDKQSYPESGGFKLVYLDQEFSQWSCSKALG